MADVWSAAAAGNENDLRQQLGSGMASLNMQHSTSGKTPLMLALAADAPGCVAALLEAGASATLAGADGLTPTHVAADRGLRWALELLYAHGAQADVACSAGPGHVTPLHLAARGGHAGACEWLVSHGADMDRPDLDGNTPVILAAAEGCRSTVEWLAAHGANVNAVNHRGNSPLHIAALRSNTACAQALLDRRADESIRNRDGRTALELAQQTGDALAAAELRRMIASRRRQVLPVEKLAAIVARKHSIDAVAGVLRGTEGDTHGDAATLSTRPPTALTAAVPLMTAPASTTTAAAAAAATSSSPELSVSSVDDEAHFNASLASKLADLAKRAPQVQYPDDAVVPVLHSSSEPAINLFGQAKELRMLEVMHHIKNAGNVTMPVDVVFEPKPARVRRMNVDTRTIACQVATVIVVAQHNTKISEDDWVLYEVWDDPPLDRLLGDYERVLDVALSWPRSLSGNRFHVRPRYAGHSDLGAIRLIAWQREFPDMSGWLHVRMPKEKSWKKRYCSLTAAGIACYKSEPKHPESLGTPLATYPVFRAARLFRCRELSGAPTQFTLCIRLPSPGSVQLWPPELAAVYRALDTECMYLCAETEESMMLWIHAATYATIHVRH